MIQQNRLLSILNIKPGEGRLVLSLLAYYCLIGLADLFTYIPAFSLFLIEFNISSLPYTYIGVGVIALVTSIVYLKLASYMSFSKLLGANLLTVLLLTVVINYRLGTIYYNDIQWLIFGLPIWYELLRLLHKFQFLGITERFFNLQQSSRLLTLFETGRQTAIIIGGFLIPTLLSLMQIRGLLFLSAISTLAAITLLRIITLRFPNKYSFKSKNNRIRIKTRESFSNLMKNRYTVSILIYTVLTWMTFYFVDNIFYNQIKIGYPNANQLAIFLGQFSAIASVITLFGLFLLTKPLISFAGLKNLLILPIILIIIATPIAISGKPYSLLLMGGVILTTAVIMLWWALLGKFFTNTILIFINIPTMNILSQPLSSKQQVQIQAIIDGIFFPISIGLSGLILSLLVVTFKFGVIQLATTLLPILIVSIIIVLWLSNKYPIMLEHTLSKRKLNSSTLSLDDSTSMAILQHSLQSDRTGEVLYALNMLYKSGSTALLVTNLPGLLNHPVPEVRREALHYIERLKLVSTLDEIEKLIKTDDSSFVLSTALRTIAAIGQIRDTKPILYPYLDEPNLQVRFGAIVGLLNHGYGDQQAFRVAIDKLTELVDSSNEPDKRILAAGIIEEVTGHDLHLLLGRLIKDEDIQIRRAALTAAEKTKYHQLWPLVMGELNTPKLRNIAVVALIAGGETILPDIEKLFNKPNQSPEIIKRIATICGRIKGEKVVELLIKHITWPDIDTRTYILVALSRCGYQVKSKSKQDDIHYQIILEVKHSTLLLASLIDFGYTSANVDIDDELMILVDALHNQLEQSRHRIFLLLSFIYSSRAILQAYHNLIMEHSELTIILLDTLISSELKAMLFPLCRELKSVERLEQLKRLFPQKSFGQKLRLYNIITDQDKQFNVWTKACALYAIGKAGIADSKMVKAVVWTIRSDIHNTRGRIYRQISVRTGQFRRVFSHTLGIFRPKTASLTEQQQISSIPAPNPLLVEAGVWVLIILKQSSAIWSLRFDADPRISRTVKKLNKLFKKGGKRMLSTIEKVIILKQATFFMNSPDETLAEAAIMMEEVELSQGETIYEQGDEGDCMYVIVSGRVKVHDGDYIINYMSENDIFGEMSILNSEPRSTSITAVEDSLLLRLDKDSLYELMEDRAEVARGVIKVLSGHLKDRTYDITELKMRLQKVEEQLEQQKAKVPV